MRFNDSLMTVLTGSAVTAIAIIQPSTAYALTGVEVNDIARNVTVLIKMENTKKDQDLHGSGVIIAKSEKTYYVLTANHVVKKEGKYRIVTGDKQPHQLKEGEVKKLPGTDLAVVQFESDKDYKIAKIASADVKQGQSIYVTGWPAPSASIPDITRQFTAGVVSNLLEKPVASGYAIVYDAVTRKGMSGGPVFDTEGRVVGIHGLGDAETEKNVQNSLGSNDDESNTSSVAQFLSSGFNLSIPISTFLKLAPQQGLYLTLQVDNKPVKSEEKANYTPPAKADERDSLNIQNVIKQEIQEGIKRGVQNQIRKLLPF
jgi:serine protease Do